MFKKIKLLLLPLLLISHASHANFVCSGTVTYLGSSPNGTMMAAVNGYGVWYLCNLESTTTVNGQVITAASCRAWYSSLLAARLTGTPVEWFFASSQSGINTPACTALGSWIAPNPIPYRGQRLFDSHAIS